MSLISLIIVLVLVGLGLWAINVYIPMQNGIKRILNVVVVLVVILWILSVFGIIGDVSSIHIGNIHK
jgi:hypothetical protein